MHQNVSVAESIVLSCFQEAGERNRIVYERENFPSVRYVYQARRGLEIAATDDVLGEIDERTLLVPVQHVLFKSGEIQDVEAIVRRAQDAGAYVVLDAYQSAGTVPLDVTALGVDFAVGGSVKWLCGGPGAGWLYVRPDLIDRLEPSVTGWQAHARPFAFETELEYADGIARFLTGTPNVPALYACTPGYDLIEEIGVARIRANSLRQTQLLIDGAESRGFEVRSPREAERRGGTVTVHVRTSRRCTRSCPSVRSSATSAPMPASAWGLTTSRPTRSSSSPSTRSPRSWRRTRTSAGSGRRRASSHVRGQTPDMAEADDVADRAPAGGRAPRRAVRAGGTRGTLSALPKWPPAPGPGPVPGQARMHPCVRRRGCARS